MIEIQQVSLARGKQKVLDELSFQFADPGIYVILGVNGSGKTLLCNLISGKCKPASGQVLIDGSPLYGLGGRYGEPIFHAQAECAFQFPETLYEYLSAEIQASGGDQDLLNQCIEYVEDEFPLGRRTQMHQLPHGLALYAQVALAAFCPCRLVTLDGHLTYLDNRLCEKAANLAADSPFAEEKFFVFTSAKLSQQLPFITQYFLLGEKPPVTISPLPEAISVNKPIQPGHLTIYFTGEWDAAKSQVSGTNFKLVGRVDHGLRLKLTGSIDGMLQELNAAGLVPGKITWD